MSALKKPRKDARIFKLSFHPLGIHMFLQNWLKLKIVLFCLWGKIHVATWYYFQVQFLQKMTLYSVYFFFKNLNNIGDSNAVKDSSFLCLWLKIQWK